MTLEEATKEMTIDEINKEIERLSKLETKE